MSLPQPIDQSAMLGGLRFHYREWPNPGAQALVLLHGFTGHARTWDSLAAAMQARYHVYALDQRGHGDSSWAEDYGVDAMVSDVDRFVRALGLKRFALLGLSMGGRTAYHYAGTHPEEVERARQANPNADPHESEHRTRHNLMVLDDGTWTFRYDRGLRSGERPLQRPDAAAAWALLEKIGAPTLLIRGEVSDVLAPETAERMVKAIRDCRLEVVARSGHSIPLERPAEFLEAVRTFL